MLRTKFQVSYMGVAVIKIICIIYIFIPFNLIRPNIRYNFNWPGSFFKVQSFKVWLQVTLDKGQTVTLNFNINKICKTFFV